MRILGHRGASQDAPENTLVAFTLALEQGADGVELDARLCASGEAVVFHDETLERLNSEGCARYVVTDIAKDGTLQGPNLELLKNVCAATDRPVVASGGVSSLDDLRAIAELVPLGVEGSIVGKALYAKAFTLEEALEVVSS